MADKPVFLKIGDRIINLDAIKLAKIEGSSLLNVYMLDGTMEQFADTEALALRAGLSQYMKEISTDN